MTTRKSNLAWGYRRLDDRWPSVEAMFLDIDGDGLLDRVTNASVRSRQHDQLVHGELAAQPGPECERKYRVQRHHQVDRAPSAQVARHG